MPKIKRRRNDTGSQPKITVGKTLKQDLSQKEQDYANKYVDGRVGGGHDAYLQLQRIVISMYI